MTHRPYQTAAIDAVRSRTVNRGIVALPTGCGKGHIAGDLIGALGVTRALYLAHREELIEQLAKHIERSTGTRPGIERAHHKSLPMDAVVVASVPTLAASNGRRLRQWDPSRFEAVIVDEAHHATAASYLKVWRHFGILGEKNEKTDAPRMPLIGLTATPGRGDKVGLDTVFDEILYQYPLVQAIRDGWLAPIHAYTYRTTTSLDGVATSRGDYVGAQLSAAVNTEDRNQGIVDARQEFAGGKRTLVFAVDIAHAEAIAGAFCASGHAASVVHGGLDSAERAARIGAFTRGALDVLVNCAVLTEGTDIPEIECVIMARPTKSPTLFAQCLGRGTRLARGAFDIAESISLGKDRCILIDVTDSAENAGRRAVRIGDIAGLPLPGEDLKGESITDALARQEAAVAAEQAKASKTGRIDLFAVEPPDFCGLTWVSVGDHLYLQIGERTLRTSEDMLGRHHLEGRGKDGPWVQLGEGFPTIEALIGTVEPWVRRRFPSEAGLLNRRARWRDDEPTEKQLHLAHKLHIPLPENATKGQVSALISAAKAQRSATVAP